MGWTNRKQEEHWQSIPGKGQAKVFLKRPSAIRTKELLDLSQKPLRIMMGLLTGHCPLNRYLLKLWLVDNPMCGRCKQAIKMDFHVLCDCVVLATLRFRHLGQHFTKPGDLRGGPYQKDTALFSKCRAAGWMSKRAVQKIENGQSAWITILPSLMYVLRSNFCFDATTLFMSKVAFCLCSP